MDQKVYFIGNAHIDPVWLWKRREGFAEIKATFQSALDRMERFDSFIFTSACALYYKWVEENEPAMFEKIRQRVAEGRWAIVGGMWVQPDCNLPSGEAFARHLLYSQRYFLEKFGKIATVGYNVDSFGHNVMLPALLRQAGIDSYVFMRPDNNEAPLPHLFDWEAPDGSHVTAFKIEGNYSDYHWNYTPEKYPGLSIYQAKVAMVKHIAAEENTPQMLFYGVGNHGGGATVRCLQELDVITASDVNVVYAAPEDYFRAVRREMPELPVIKTDLHHHASGCYAANSSTKQANRRVENRLVSAEKYDVLASCLAGAPTGKSGIRSAYEKLMLNQFHDILCGCSIKEAVDEAGRYFSAAWAQGEDVAEAALQKLSWNVNTANGIRSRPSGKEDWLIWESDGQGAPVVVFNPHCFPVTQQVKLGFGTVTGVTDQDGNPIPLQHLHGSPTNRNHYQTLFTAQVPALGYSTYYLYTLKSFNPEPACKAVAGEDFLENDYLKVTFDKHTGAVCGFYDKQRGVNYMTNGARALVIDDSDSDPWAHMIFKFDRQIGQFSDAEVAVLEQGPLLATIRVTSRYNRSTLVQDFSLDPFSKILSVKCRLDFQETRKIVKLAFPLTLADETVSYEVPFGFSSKAPNGQEEPGHRYINLSGTLPDGGEGAMALLNDSKYSFSAADHEMRMTVARGCAFSDHWYYLQQPLEYQDQGIQEFSYALMPHDNDLAAVTRSAMLINQSLEYVQETNHEGPLPVTYSGIEIASESVVCETIKYAEAQDALVLRMYEISGKDADCRVCLSIPGFETQFSTAFGKHQIKSLMVFRDHTVKEVNLLEL